MKSRQRAAETLRLASQTLVTLTNVLDTLYLPFINAFPPLFVFATSNNTATSKIMSIKNMLDFS
jgi:hypothetical protein